MIQASLGDFPDNNKFTLPLSVARTKDIPPQVSSDSEAETAELIATIIKTATVATGAVQLVFEFMLHAGLG